MQLWDQTLETMQSQTKLKSPTLANPPAPDITQTQNDPTALEHGSHLKSVRDWKVDLIDEAREFLTSRFAAEYAAEITLSELVSTAFRLSQYYGGKSHACAYFSEAREMLCLGRYYLARAPLFAMIQNSFASFHGHAPRTFAFDVILRPVVQSVQNGRAPDGSRKGSKKGGPTMVGSITTQQGLIKALKRIEGDNWQSLIQRKNVRCKGKVHEERCLTQEVIDRIREDQLNRNLKKTLRARQEQSKGRR